MAWIKIPVEHHPLFRAALPRGATTKNMFGGIAAFVNDQMFGGLFAHSIIVKLSTADQQEALALDGAALFDPMGNGRIMRDIILLPADVMDEPVEMRSWLQRAYDHVATLPPKVKARPKKEKAISKAPRSKPAAKATKATRKPRKPKSAKTRSRS